jgi:hypothetical protein
LISTQGALSVKLRNGQDVDPAHLSPSAGFFGSAANIFRRKPSELEAPPSAANPSVLCGEQVETETDVLYVQKMPTFDGSLGAADAELVCSYLTAPYLRIPLLLQFFSAPARFAALGCIEMQRVLDAALFEPGAYASPDAADAWFAPAPEKRHNAPSTAPAPKEKLSTTLGLLVNELHRSPDMLVAAAKGFRTRISELDPGTSRGVAEGGHAAAILYALRLLSRLDGYAALVQDEETRVRGSRVPEVSAAGVAELRSVLQGILRDDAPPMLDRWLRRSAAESRDSLAESCAVRAVLACIARPPCLDADARCASVVGAQLFLSQNWNFAPPSKDRKKKMVVKERASLGTTHSELFGCFATLRPFVLALARDGKADACFEDAVAALTNVKPPAEARKWVELEGAHKGWATTKRYAQATAERGQGRRRQAQLRGVARRVHRRPGGRERR